MGLSLNMTEQLAFYGAYHTHWLNQLIHFFCVPLILWTILVWLAAAGPLLPASLVGAAAAHAAWLPPAAAAALQPTNGAFLVAALYGSFYVLLDFVAGATWALAVGLPLAWSATAFAMGGPVAVAGVSLSPAAVAAVAHVFGWYMQLHPGHAVCERRKPALMDSLVQAFALAPLFVWFELLFLLGYRPGLKATMGARVRELIAAMDGGRQRNSGSAASAAAAAASAAAAAKPAAAQQ